MPIYEDFRVRVSPDVAEPGRWSVVVRDAPFAAAIDKRASTTPLVKRADLQRLRSPNGWPDVGCLRRIGDAVWKSVLQGDVDAAFTMSLEMLQAQGKCLRLICVIQGDEAADDGAAPDRVRLSELPVELLYSETFNFLGTDLNTPISRSFQDVADRDPEQIGLPLRVLVLVAAPVDKPGADTAEEERALRSALEAFDPTESAIKVDVVQDATRDDLARLSTRRYDVVHFIGHGGFDIVGDDPTPRAHICLVRSDGTRRSDILDADTLDTILRNTPVRLAIFTACATAAAAPPDVEPYAISAFEGVSQRLVAGISGVTAAVAMQFDLESEAAVAFTSAFYEQLVRPDVSLDEAVTVARKRLVAKLDAGHRAWVTPTVLWRCKAAKVFATDPSRSELDPAVAAELEGVETLLRFIRDHIAKINREPVQYRPALANTLQDLQTRMGDLETRRGELLGESLRVHGTTAVAGDEVRFPMVLRTRIAGTVAQLSFEIAYPDDLVFLGADAGDGGVPLAVPDGAGGLSVTLQPPPGEPWNAGHRDACVLRFQVREDVEPKIVELRVARASLTRDAQPVALRPVDGVLFVDQPPAIPAEE